MTFVTRIAGAAAISAAILFGCGLLASPAQSGYIVTLTQQGTSVVATGSGSIDVTDPLDLAVEHPAGGHDPRPVGGPRLRC